ncbi:MAG: AAA family ATPase, partial [Solirubrobacteraceae bacterium]
MTEDDAGHGLHERGTELAELARLVARACAGEGALVLIEGAAGIGKSSLVQAGRRLAIEAGMAVLDGCGAGIEREFPFGVARQLFEPALAHLAATERDELLCGAAALAAPLVWDAPVATAAPAGDPAFPVLHGLYWLVAGLIARRPLALCVDDAHWGDSGSLRFLAYLARRVSGLPLLVVVATRTAEPSTDPRSLQALSDEALVVLRPLPLSEQAAGEVVAEVLGAGDEALARACHEASGGNPFLLRELCATLALEHVRSPSAGAERVRTLGPATVARAALTRLARLDRAAPELARAVAVLGDRAAVADAAAVAGLD